MIGMRIASPWRLVDHRRYTSVTSAVIPKCSGAASTTGSRVQNAPPPPISSPRELRVRDDPGFQASLAEGAVGPQRPATSCKTSGRRRRWLGWRVGASPVGQGEGMGPPHGREEAPPEVAQAGAGAERRQVMIST